MPGEGPQQPRLSAPAGGCAQDPDLYPASSTEILPCWAEQPEGSCCSQGALSQLLKLAGQANISHGRGQRGQGYSLWTHAAWAQAPAQTTPAVQPRCGTDLLSASVSLAVKWR